MTKYKSSSNSNMLYTVTDEYHLQDGTIVVQLISFNDIINISLKITAFLSFLPEHELPAMASD